MSLVENVSDAYGIVDGPRVEAIAKTILEECFGRVLVDADHTTLRAEARKGNPNAKKCISLAAIFVNYMREELE